MTEIPCGILHPGLEHELWSLVVSLSGVSVLGSVRDSSNDNMDGS